MKFGILSRVVLPVTSILAGLWLTAIHAQIVVTDNFMDEAARQNLLSQLPAQAHFKHTIELPGQLYRQLLSVLNCTRATELTIETSVPARGEWVAVGAHKDMFDETMVAEGPVCLIYLDGDGHMQFQHEVTGEKTVVNVTPGRLLSWDNAMYTHTLLPGNKPRRFLGPMVFQDGGMRSVGAVLSVGPSTRIYYMVVKKDIPTNTFLFESLVPQLEHWCSKIIIHTRIGMVSANCTKELIEASSTNETESAIDILNELPEVVTLTANLPDLSA